MDTRGIFTRVYKYKCTRPFVERTVALKKQGLLVGSFVLLLAVFVAKAAGLLFKIPLTNILGGTGMGYYSAAYTVFTPIFALCAASLPSAITQLVSESEARGKYRSIKSIKRVSLIVFSGLSLVVSVMMALLSDLIARRIIGSPESAWAIAAIAPCVFISTVMAIYRGYFEGLRNMTPTAVSQIIEAICRLVFGLGFAYLADIYSPALGISERLPFIAAAAVLGVTVSNLAGLIYLMLRSKLSGDINPELSALDTSVERYRTVLKRIVLLMIPMSLASLASSLMGAVDLSTIILGIKSSLGKNPQVYMEKYGEVIASGVSLDELPNFLYGSFTGLAMTVFSLAPSLCSAFGKSALPTITECWAKGDNERARFEIKRIITIVMYISVPAGLGLCAMSENILGLLFSSRTIEAMVSVRPLQILSLGTPLLAVGGAAFAMLQAVGRQDLPVKITVVGAIIKLAGNTLLIPLPEMELSGAALSTVISYGVICLWSVCALYKIAKTKTSLFISVIFPIFAGIVASAGAKIASIYLFKDLAKLLNSLFSVCFAVIIYIIAVVLLDITTKNALKSKIF